MRIAPVNFQRRSYPGIDVSDRQDVRQREKRPPLAARAIFEVLVRVIAQVSPLEFGILFFGAVGDNLHGGAECVVSKERALDAETGIDVELEIFVENIVRIFIGFINRIIVEQSGADATETIPFEFDFRLQAAGEGQTVQ